MKKFLQLHPIAMIAALLLTGAGAHAQGGKVAGDDQGLSPKAPIISKMEKDLSADIPYRNNINIKAIRHFSNSFANASEERWFTIKNGYMVKCVVDSVKTRVDYDNRGQWVATIRYYEEEKLPKEIRALVKSTWFDYKIVLVEEVRFPTGSPVYVVHINWMDDWKNIRVQDGTVEEMDLPGKN